MLTNIRKCKMGEEKSCICNGGIQYTDMVGKLNEFEVVYYNDKSIAIFLSLAHVIRTRRLLIATEVTYATSTVEIRRL